MENRLKMTYHDSSAWYTRGEKRKLHFFLTVILFLLRDCMHNRDCEWLAVMAKLALFKNKASPFGADYQQSDGTIVQVNSSEHEGNLDLQGYWNVMCTHCLALTRFQDKTMPETWKKKTREVKWGRGGTKRRSLEEERERIISVSGAFSRREQMYASTQRLPLCTELAPWWVLAAAVSILCFPWTPDALTPAAQPFVTPPPPPSRPQSILGSWAQSLSFNANPWALSFPGTLPGAVESSETAGCPQGINDSWWRMWRETILKSGRPPVSDGRGCGQKLWPKKKKEEMLFSLVLHCAMKDFAGEKHVTCLGVSR